MSQLRLLRVDGAEVGAPPTVLRDDYPPLKVVWSEPHLRQGSPPHYVRVSGTNGGEFEFRIDRASNKLLAFTILIPGALEAEVAPPYPEASCSGVGALLVEAPPEEPTVAGVLNARLPVRVYQLRGGFRLDIVGLSLARYLECGPAVGIALAENDSLASISALALSAA